MNDISFLVFGNGAIDHHVQATSIEPTDTGVSITLESGERKFIALDDTPFVSGKKHTVHNIERLIERIEGEVQAGGGAYNSARSLDRIREHAAIKFGIYTVDVSSPHPAIDAMAGQHDIKAYFAGLRSIPNRLVVSGQHEVLNIGGTSLERITEVDSQTARHLDQLPSMVDVKSCLITSAKDEAYVLKVKEIALLSKAALFFVPTPSLSYAFVKKEMFNRGTVIVSWNDILELDGTETDMPDLEKIEHTHKIMREIMRSQHDKHNIYVTLGPYGALCGFKDDVYHIMLHKDIALDVRGAFEKRVGSSNAAGDHFAASVMFFETFVPRLMLDVASVGKMACKHVIGAVGYSRPINSANFSNQLVTMDYFKRLAEATK